MADAADLPIGPIKGVRQTATFPPLPDPAQFAGHPPVKWEPTGEYFVSDGYHWMRSQRGAPAIPQQTAFPTPAARAPAPRQAAPQATSREDAINQFLGVAPAKKAPQTGPKARKAAIQGYLDLPDVAAPPPEPSKLWENFKKNVVGPPSRFVTEGLPAAGRAFTEHQTAPTYGQGLMGGPLKYTPLPGILDLAEKAMRLPSSFGAGVAELGPEAAKPLTKAGAEQLPFLPWMDLLRRGGRAAPLSSAAPGQTLPPQPPAPLALPPATRGQHVPGAPAYDAEGHLIRETFTPAGAPRALTGQPGPAGELPPHVNWRQTTMGEIVPTEREGTLISDRFTPSVPPKALGTGIKGALPPRSFRDPKTGAIISPPGEGPVAGGVSPTGRRILPSEELAQRFGIELEEKGAPQAAPKPAARGEEPLSGSAPSEESPLLRELADKNTPTIERKDLVPEGAEGWRVISRFPGWGKKSRTHEGQTFTVLDPAGREQGVTYGEWEAHNRIAELTGRPKVDIAQKMEEWRKAHPEIWEKAKKDFPPTEAPLLEDPRVAPKPKPSETGLLGKGREAAVELARNQGARLMEVNDRLGEIERELGEWHGPIGSPQQIAKRRALFEERDSLRKLVGEIMNPVVDEEKLGAALRAARGKKVPKFERTPEGMQGMIEGTPPPELKLKGGESTVFTDKARAAREAELSKAQETIPSHPVPPSPTASAPSRGFGQSSQGFEHGVPNLDNPKDLYQIVRGAGGIKTTEDLAGELRSLPTWAKNKKGQTLDQIAESLADQYPHLGDRQAIKEKIADNLGRYNVLKGEAKARGSIKPPEPGADVVELHTNTPPADIPVDPAEWKLMGPMQRKSALDFFRETLTDESGRLNLGQMMDALKRFRKKFPMEEAVRKERPNSPVIAETERWTTGLSDGISQIAQMPWWKAIRKMSPDALKDLEQQMFDIWDQGGRTQQAYNRAIAVAPPEIRDYLRHREQRLNLENVARRWFGLPEIREVRAPYLPRQVEEESLNQVTLGSGALGPRGRGPTTSAGPHMKARSYDTYRQGEAQGAEYADPRNEALLREWTGVKIRSTYRLFKNLEAKGAIFRDQAQATAASPTGQAWKIKNAPGGEWFTPTESEARFLQQNLTESQRGPTTSLVGYGNALLRNPNLVNPAPHVVKNMAVKAFLARGPVTPYVLARDAVEYFRGTNPQLLREFNEAMPFSSSGKVAGDILGGELRSGTVQDGIRTALRTLGKINRPSQKVIFEWADPAMRYAMYKHYRQQGMGVYEAGNHAWVDLIRYGTRSQVTDMWKSWPLNFFVPWRFGTFVSLVKQVQNHPIRTALLVGALDYMREVRYRQTGRWFHLPHDYVAAPIAQIVQSKDAKEFAKNIGSQAALTALFGPGGAFAASQMEDMMKVAQGKGDPYEYERLAKMFWGLGQLYDVTLSDKHGGVSGVLGSLLLGEHNALTYEPRRLMRGLPESLPGLRKSSLVQEAESMQQSREEKRLRREERRKERPRNTIEDRLRAAGYLR